MKYLFTLTLIVAFSLALNAQKRQDMEAFFKPKQTFSNPITAKTYFLEDSLKCSNTLILNSDSTFLREIGCDGHSFVTVGNWRQFKDSIELTALKQENINLIHSVKTIHNQADTTITFYFTDKLGQPIKEARLIEISLLVINNEKGQYGRRNKSIRYDLKTNKKGKIDIKKWGEWGKWKRRGRWEQLNFYKFQEIMNKPFKLKIENLPSEIHIQLNINQLGVLYSDLKYYYFDKPKVFKYTEAALKTDTYTWKRVKLD